MARVIACRIFSYGKYQDRAWTHLPEIGIRNVEMPAPPAPEWAATKRKLGDHGLKATSLQSLCDLTRPDAVEVMRPQLEACAEFGSNICFLSAKPGDTPLKDIWERLRAMGDVAAGYDVTIVLETHPPLVTHGDLGRETMAAIDHPRVRINFDTGNIHFYNKGRTATDELAKVADLVAAVHLKDHTGRFEEWSFPVLGQGVVDFPGIFRMLDERGFQGPCTMELEGSKGQEFTEQQQCQYVADSVAYLRSIGALK